MATNDIEAKVKAIIVEKLGVDEADITPEASFTNDLGADSLDTVELIMEFEKEFDITIPDEEAEKIVTVGDAIKYLKEKIGQADRASVPSPAAPDCAMRRAFLYLFEPEATMAQQRRVVVTGMGALTPIGLNVPDFWEALLQGKSGAAPITRFDPTPFDTHFACELKGFDPLDYMDRKTARRLDPFAQYALVAADEALRDAGLDPEKLSASEKDRIGVVFGSGIGGMQVFQDQTAQYLQRGARFISPLFIPMLIPDISAGHLAIRYGFRGPNYAVVSACATANHNLGDAYLLIQRGMADVVLCGGSEAPITEMALGGFNAMKALSTRNDDPARASRPFDATRDGFVMGEGAGALVLEELEHARRRGARIYAEVLGIGMSADAHHITAPDPEGEGAALAMQHCCATPASGPKTLTTSICTGRPPHWATWPKRRRSSASSANTPTG